MESINQSNDEVKINKPDWLKIIEEFKNSGLNQTAFCKKYGIKQDLFWYHLRRFRLKNGESTKRTTKMSFLPVEIPQENLKLTIDNGIALEFPNSFTMEQLSLLIIILRRNLCS